MNLSVKRSITCPYCGYPSTTATCPECGVELKPTRMWRAACRCSRIYVSHLIFFDTIAIMLALTHFYVHSKPIPYQMYGDIVECLIVILATAAWICLVTALAAAWWVWKRRWSLGCVGLIAVFPVVCLGFLALAKQDVPLSVRVSLSQSELDSVAAKLQTMKPGEQLVINGQLGWIEVTNAVRLPSSTLFNFGHLDSEGRKVSLVKSDRDGVLDDGGQAVVRHVYGRWYLTYIAY